MSWTESLSIRVVLFAILTVDGVESKPGPSKPQEMRHDRGDSIASNSGASRGRWATGGGHGPQDNQQR